MYGVSDFFCRALGEEDQARAALAEQSLNASDYSSLVPGVVLHESTEISCLHCAKRFFGPYAITIHFQLYAFPFNTVIPFIHVFDRASAAFIIYTNPHVFMTLCCTWMRYALSNAHTSLEFPSLRPRSRWTNV